MLHYIEEKDIVVSSLHSLFFVVLQKKLIPLSFLTSSPLNNAGILQMQVNLRGLLNAEQYLQVEQNYLVILDSSFI